MSAPLCQGLCRWSPWAACPTRLHWSRSNPPPPPPCYFLTLEKRSSSSHSSLWLLVAAHIHLLFLWFSSLVWLWAFFSFFFFNKHSISEPFLFSRFSAMSSYLFILKSELPAAINSLLSADSPGWVYPALWAPSFAKKEIQLKICHSCGLNKVILLN